MYYIGVDIGGMSIKCGIVGEDGRILGKKSALTPEGDYNAVIEVIGALCRDTADSVGISWADIDGIGAGIPGTTHKGTVSFASNLGWYGVPFDTSLNSVVGKKVVSGNDANCALLAEWRFGNAKGTSNAGLITLGTGIGTAFIVEGKMLLGNLSAGTEGGHMVIKSGGRACNCGLQGCWEAYASTTALLNATEREIETNPSGITAAIAKERGKVDGETIFHALRRGDTRARAVFDIYLDDVAVGLINLVNLLRPEIILIGGGISNEEELLIKPIEKIVNEKVYGGEYNPFVAIRKASFGNAAGIIGAACLVM